MREIKFKAYWHESKLTTTVDTIEFLNGGTRVSDGCMHTGWLGKDCELRQYTGPKDKNGVEIYDGSIVKDKLGNNFSISFNPEFCAYFLYPKEDPEEFMAFYPDIDLTVIGNRYENPELLEGNQ